MADRRPTWRWCIETAWFEKDLAVFLWPLLPLSWLFAAIGAVRRLAYRRRWLQSMRMPVPVVVVGNLIVGGAGKTPLVIHLVESLQSAGRRPGIVSRGYRGAGAAGEVFPGDDPSRVGDEPVLLARRCGVPVFVGRRRAEAGAALLRAYPEVDVLIADDGLQHYALARDVEIVVADRRGFGNGRLLPAGPLREPPSRLDAVDALVVHAGAPDPGRPCFVMRLRPDRFHRLGDEATRATAAEIVARLAGRSLHAIAGIGHPARFFATLREIGMDFVDHAFPDHHPYQPDDLAFAAGAVLLMTEKDAVKCRAFHRGEAWVLPVSAEVSPELSARVLEIIDGRQTA